MFDQLPGGDHRRERAGATSAPRIRRDFSLRKASALEPQRLSRRRFPLSPPFGVTGPMKARSRLAVRNFLPSRPRDDRLATEQTGGERIGDEAIADPGVDPLALATDGGGTPVQAQPTELPSAMKQPARAREQPSQHAQSSSQAATTRPQCRRHAARRHARRHSAEHELFARRAQSSPTRHRRTRPACSGSSSPGLRQLTTILRGGRSAARTTSTDAALDGIQPRCFDRTVFLMMK